MHVPAVNWCAWGDLTSLTPSITFPFLSSQDKDPYSWGRAVGLPAEHFSGYLDVYVPFIVKNGPGTLVIRRPKCAVPEAGSTDGGNDAEGLDRERVIGGK